LSNVIKWQVPSKIDVSYDLALVYRSTTKDGSYSLLKTQSITDNTYFDQTGSTTDWYKIRFQDSSTNQYSQYSSPILGGKFAGYCTIDDIRNFSSKMDSKTISDSQLFELIKFATAQINQDILTEYRDEPVVYLSNDKENDVDGVNTTFYVVNPYLADYNDDGIIDGNDLYVYSIDSTGTRTEYTVSSIDDARHGKYTLSTAPANGVRLYSTYRSSPVLLYPTVNINVRKAAINYVLGLAHMRLDPNQMRSFRVNKISVTGDSSPSKAYMQNYNNLISKINSKLVKMKKAEYVV